MFGKVVLADVADKDIFIIRCWRLFTWPSILYFVDSVDPKYALRPGICCR